MGADNTVINNRSINPIILSSARVIMEPISLSGLDDFNEYSLQNNFYKFLEFKPFTSKNDSKIYLEKLISRSNKDFNQYWFIKAKSENKIIGTFGLHSLNYKRLSCEIGYGLSPDYWGEGYFIESAKLILSYAFNNLQIRRIVAITASENLASIKGLEKLGFHHEGLMSDYYRNHHGKWFDAVLMSKINT